VKIRLALFAFVLLLVNFACAPEVGEALEELQQTAAAQAAELAKTQAAALLETSKAGIATQADAALETLIAGGQTEVAGFNPFGTQDPVIDRQEIIARAERWAALKVPYGSFDSDPSNDLSEGYRADCSGFISYTWGLPQPGPDTTSLVSGGYAIEIPIDLLQMGDVLNNKRVGSDGHIVLFAEWLNSERTLFRGFDLNTYPGYVSEKTFTLVLYEDGWTIAELDPWADGPYSAMRQVQD
jgi:hypothetical protein